MRTNQQNHANKSASGEYGVSDDEHMKEVRSNLVTNMMYIVRCILCYIDNKSGYLYQNDRSNYDFLVNIWFRCFGDDRGNGGRRNRWAGKQGSRVKWVFSSEPVVSMFNKFPTHLQMMLSGLHIKSHLNIFHLIDTRKSRPVCERNSAQRRLPNKRKLLCKITNIVHVFTIHTQMYIITSVGAFPQKLHLCLRWTITALKGALKCLLYWFMGIPVPNR